jgi:hypothetical protein
MASSAAASAAAVAVADDDDDDLEAQIARELAEEGVLVGSSQPGAGLEDEDIHLSDDDFIEVQGD